MSAFSTTGLARLNRRMRDHVAAGHAAGLVTAVSRHGEMHVAAVGLQSLDDPAPMRRDTIFRIASMTKPMTAVTAMTLVEEGVLALDVPVDELLPELADMRVLKSLDAKVSDTVPASRSITLRDLLTFRLGTGAVMAMPGTHPIQAAMAEQGLEAGPEQFEFGADEYLKRLGSLPLLAQPGTAWHYDTGTDVLGVLIARATGQRLGDVMQARLFGPLGMKDTAFGVPADKLDRFATSYQADRQTGALNVWDDARTGLWATGLPFQSGSGGLASTADDLLTFHRMMLGQGRLGEIRILSRPSVALMTTDHLTTEQRVSAPIFFGEGTSWGLGLSVCIKRTDVFTTPGRFGWDGGYGTSAYADPAEDMIGILLTQRLMDSPIAPPTYRDFWTMAYAALAD